MGAVVLSSWRWWLRKGDAGFHCARWCVRMRCPLRESGARLAQTFSAVGLQSSEPPPTASCWDLFWFPPSRHHSGTRYDGRILGYQVRMTGEGRLKGFRRQAPAAALVICLDVVGHAMLGCQFYPILDAREKHRPGDNRVWDGAREQPNDATASVEDRTTLSGERAAPRSPLVDRALVALVPERRPRRCRTQGALREVL